MPEVVASGSPAQKPSPPKEYSPLLERTTLFMGVVQHYRESLRDLQTVWDSLALLGHLSSTGTDMTETRRAFQGLSDDLVANMAKETLKNTVIGLKSKAQVAVDILIRNLYERTADIGFLASDDGIRNLAADHLSGRSAPSGAMVLASAVPGDAASRASVRMRFQEYVEKYSIYHEVMLIAPDGEVLVQLGSDVPVQRTSDPLVAESLATSAPYVETFRPSDLLPTHRVAHVYSCRVLDDSSRPVGVLCLFVRFEDEMAGVFASLRHESDWTELLLLDEKGCVLSSSDEAHIPVGAKMQLATMESGRLVRFAGREYLATSRPTSGYQGYFGPGWMGHALIPLEYAFDRTETHESVVREDVLDAVRETPGLFSDALREIPRQAGIIQGELSRSVWNGNIRQRGQRKESASFSKALLSEISLTGSKTEDVFGRSIRNLHESVVAAILRETAFLSSLAANLLDRNFYERANDCRWWALDPRLLDALKDPQKAELATRVLVRTGALYTVYASIVLFDANRVAVAISNPEYQALVGTCLADEWLDSVLALRSSRDYVQSAFRETALCKSARTFGFGAAIRNEAGRPIGGIALAFNSREELSRILSDALPKDERGEPAAGAVGLFVDAHGYVVASTSRFQVGERISFFQPDMASKGRELAEIVAIDGSYYAVGAAPCVGYREYKGAGVFALILTLLGRTAEGSRPRRMRQSKGGGPAIGHTEDSVELATLYIGDHHYGILADRVVEAIGVGNVTPVPGMPPHVRGLFGFRGKLYPLLDVGALNGGGGTETAKSIVVVRASDEAEPFGILADELGDIPEIPKSRVEPAGRMVSGAQAAIIESIVRPEDSSSRALLVLSLTGIQHRAFVSPA